MNTQQSSQGLSVVHHEIRRGDNARNVGAAATERSGDETQNKSLRAPLDYWTTSEDSAVGTSQERNSDELLGAACPGGGRFCGGEGEEVRTATDKEGCVDANDWEWLFRNVDHTCTDGNKTVATSGEPSMYPVSIRQPEDKIPAALLGKKPDADTSVNTGMEEGQELHVRKETASPEEAFNLPADGDKGQDGFVRFVDIGPNDVLFGRGPKINDNIGNVAFRRIVATRKAEYFNTNAHKEKNRIAKEIVDHIRRKVDPPGRFLTVVVKSVAEAMELPADVEMWRPVDDKTALEKTKQTLRQIKKWGGAEEAMMPARRQVVGTLAGEEPRGNDERDAKRAGGDIISTAQGSGVSSTTCNVDETSIAESKGWVPTALENSEAPAVGENDTPLGVSCMIESANSSASSTDGALQVVPPADASQAQLGQVQATVIMPSGRMMSGDPGIGASVVGSSFNEMALAERASLLESICIASELVKKTREVHDAGAVAYESNIGVNGSHLTGDLIRSDLVSLGSDLYRSFAGVDPFVESRDGTGKVEENTSALEASSIAEEIQTKKKERRRSTSRQYVPLRDLGLPVSLCILVSSLLDAEDEGAADRYQTADDVEEDLRLMIANPERYLFDACGDRQTGQLVLSEDRLYGRERHLVHMKDMFNRVAESTSGPREMLLISGYAGTGKSVLVEHLRRPVLQRNGYYVSGKFEQLGQAQPTSVIFDAFNELCDTISKCNEVTLHQTRGAVQEALGCNAGVLINLIPNLNKVIGVPATEAVQVGGREALNRFLFYFRRFVRAISSPSHPVILFLDDLQWADKQSLDLVSTIVSDSEITSLLFVGCFRDNAVGIDHPLTKEAGKLASAGVGIATIKLENFDRRSVNALISDTLRLSPRLTWPLSDLVFNKTSGNPLFAIQFLKSLSEDKLLRFSAQSRRWEWNIKAIEAKDIADNVVDLMTGKILKLNSEVQWLLKVAACLGSQCEASTLELLGFNIIREELGTAFLLDVCVHEGLMCKLGSGSVYKFSHDQIQQAAYSLIPENEREALHLHIGRSAEELERLIFVAADQLQRGKQLITDHDEEVELARLCLTAGEKAMSSSAFPQAAIYLLQGSVLMRESDWNDHYNLFLQLLSSLAETQYAMGNRDGLEISVNSISEHGRCLQDKLWAIGNQLRSTAAQGNAHDALDVGFKILVQLGEPFPKELDGDTVKLDFAKTRDLCQGTTIDEILKKESMTDPNKVAAMKFLVILARCAFQLDQYLCSMIVFRMVQLTICHGVCQDSPYAFASLGVIFCSSGEMEQGCHYAKLALSLLDKLKAKEHLARVYCLVYTLINGFSQPLQSIPCQLNHGFEAGMSTGDIEYGLGCAHSYCWKSILSGRKLDSLAEEVSKYVQVMKDYKHNTLPVTLPILQAILNLRGETATEDPTKLTGEAMNQEEVLMSALEKHQWNVVKVVNFLHLWLTYIFRRLNVAADLAEQHRQFFKTQPLSLEQVVDQTFYTGLIAMERLRGGDEKEWRSIACESLKKMEIWARSSNWNFEHKLDLLRAEMAYLNGNIDKAVEAYEKAIAGAGNHGFIHEQALACEVAGAFHYEISNAAVAAECFAKARKYYLDWGATRKADDLLRLLTES